MSQQLRLELNVPSHKSGWRLGKPVCPHCILIGAIRRGKLLLPDAEIDRMWKCKQVCSRCGKTSCDFCASTACEVTNPFGKFGVKYLKRSWGDEPLYDPDEWGESEFEKELIHYNCHVNPLRHIKHSNRPPINGIFAEDR